MPKTIIKSNCRNPLQEIQGTALIQYSNCTVNINGVIYEDKPAAYWDKIKLATLPHSQIQAKLVKDTLNLQKLQQFEIENKQTVLSIKESTQTSDICTYTAITILCIAIILVFIYATKKIRIYYVSQMPQNAASAPPKSLWPSLYSMGGGVTYWQHVHNNLNDQQPIPPAKPKRNNTNITNDNSSNERISH